MAAPSPPPLCQVVGSGWLFPVTQFEVDLPEALRVVLYGLLMVYFFLGVSIIADIFMSSIDEITSRRSWVLCGTRFWTPKVWNSTVATLSLMAVGSSAPEIFLATVEIFKKEFLIGPLGTSTIAGSAAFNLLIIISVCIASIPAGEERHIKDLTAFYITALFSIIAYVWLALILYDERIQWWEGILTLTLMPILIYISYKADIGALDEQLIKFNIKKPESDDGPYLLNEVIEFDPQDDFEVKNEYIVYQNRSTQHLEIIVKHRGVDSATCEYSTERLTAVPGYHYEEAEGSLDFPPGISEQYIDIKICPGCSQIDRNFIVILSEPCGAEFDKRENGGNEGKCITLVTIRPPLPEEEKVDRNSGGPHLRRKSTVEMVEATVGSIYGVRRALDEWKVQVTEAIYCGGSKEEQMNSSNLDFVGHVIAMPWKLCFAWAPPLYCLQGWARFAWSLAGISAMTMMISDCAELFGCILDLPDIFTALVFVALGTSMPDLFASLSAAKEDPTADAAIVNVTGSNSVNVFLGVGIPYSVAAIYWESKGVEFKVQTDGLVFSITCFCCVCVGAIAILYARRQLLGCELGGPTVPKFFCSAVFLSFWILFVGVASWRVIKGREEGVTGTQELRGVIVLCCLVLVLTSATILLLFKHRVRKDDRTEGSQEKSPETSVDISQSEDTKVPAKGVTLMVPSSPSLEQDSKAAKGVKVTLPEEQEQQDSKAAKGVKVTLPEEQEQQEHQGGESKPISSVTTETEDTSSSKARVVGLPPDKEGKDVSTGRQSTASEFQQRHSTKKTARQLARQRLRATTTSDAGKRPHRRGSQNSDDGEGGGAVEGTASQED